MLRHPLLNERRTGRPPGGGEVLPMRLEAVDLLPVEPDVVGAVGGLAVRVTPLRYRLALEHPRARRHLVAPESAHVAEHLPRRATVRDARHGQADVGGACLEEPIHVVRLDQRVREQQHHAVIRAGDAGQPRAGRPSTT